MKQIITRVDDELANSLKRQASRIGESVNSYVNRLLRAAVTGPGTHRHEWKAAAISNGQLMSRKNPTTRYYDRAKRPVTNIRTPPGYSSKAVSYDRDEQ